MPVGNGDTSFGQQFCDVAVGRPYRSLPADREEHETAVAGCDQMHRATLEVITPGSDLRRPSLPAVVLPLKPCPARSAHADAPRVQEHAGQVTGMVGMQVGEEHRLQAGESRVPRRRRRTATRDHSRPRTRVRRPRAPRRSPRGRRQARVRQPFQEAPIRLSCSPLLSCGLASELVALWLRRYPGRSPHHHGTLCRSCPSQGTSTIGHPEQNVAGQRRRSLHARHGRSGQVSSARAGRPWSSRSRCGSTVYRGSFIEATPPA